MPRGSKAKYTPKQKRKAQHIEKGLKKRGMSDTDAAGKAWATVNKIHKGGEKPGGGGYGKEEDRSVNKKGGQRGGKAGAGRSKSHPALARKRTKSSARG